jgi:MurNAc alpha-1-phosphate uridylyltransferase
MILCAGRGTRMGALTDARPKPMLPVAGRPLIDHALARAAEGGARRIVVNLHHLGAQIRAHLAGRADVSFSEEAELLETGGGLVAARPLLGEAPFYALNADAIWTGSAPLAPLAAAWDPARKPMPRLELARKRSSSIARSFLAARN